MPVDRLTKELGRIKTLKHAKRVCINRNGRLPRIGREMCIDYSDAHQTWIARTGKGLEVRTHLHVGAPGDYDENGIRTTRNLTNAMPQSILER